MLFETFTKLRALLHEYVFLSTKGIFPSYLTFSYILILQVAKQWYDFDRQTFTFVKKLKEKKEPLKFTYHTDFDENGLLYWIGSNAKLVS